MPRSLHIARIADMDPVMLYAVLRLRTDIFVVEQECPYPELDGRDIERDSQMVWVEDDNAVVATLRILRDPDALRIGRVAAHASQRGSGIAREMFAFALEQCAKLGPGLPIALDAQAPLEGWYGSFGFVRDGEPFLEDGIPHVPMSAAAAVVSSENRKSAQTRKDAGQ